MPTSKTSTQQRAQRANSTRQQPRSESAVLNGQTRTLSNAQRQNRLSEALTGLTVNNQQPYRRNIDSASIADKFKGTFDQILRDRLSNNMSVEETKCVNAMLNPGHQTNTADASPICDASSGRTFVFRASWTERFDLADAETECTFITSPFFEIPFMSCKGTTQWFAYDAPNTHLGTNDISASYLKDIGAYAYRCIGKSMTIENQTKTIDLGGVCTVGRKTCDVDCSNLSFTENIATTAQNQRVLQRLPNGSREVTQLLGTVAQWKASEGAYIISHHEDYDWINRDSPINKCYPHALLNPANVNCALKGTDATSENALTISYFNDITKPVYTGPPDHTDIAIAHFNGLGAGVKSFNLKMCVSYEIKLKAGSPYLAFTVPRPIPNPRLLNFIKMFETHELALGGFPADYNFWDKVWSTFKKIWKNGGGNLITTGINAIQPGLGSGIGAAVDVLSKL